jgi:hypothetical protein
MPTGAKTVQVSRREWLEHENDEMPNPILGSASFVFAMRHGRPGLTPTTRVPPLAATVAEISRELGYVEPA